MSEEIEVVKLQSRKVKGYEAFLVTIPKSFVHKLGWKKGDVLAVRLTRVDVDGKEVQGIVIYKIV